MYRRPAPAPALTPAARALRTEIIARPGTLFTHARPYRDLNPMAPLALDPRGDATHLAQSVRDEALTPGEADGVLAHVVASVPHSALEDMGVTLTALTEAIIASRPYQPVCA